MEKDSAMEAELKQVESLRRDHKDELEVPLKTPEQTWEDFFADSENIKFITPTNLPTHLWRIIAVIAFAVNIIAIISAIVSSNSVLEGLAIAVDGILIAIVIFGFRKIDAPNQAIAECLGKPYAIWGAGPHILIPGLMEMKPPMPIDAEIPIDIFVDEKDESDRIPLQDDFIRALQTQFRFKIKDVLKATYKISVSGDYIRERLTEGVDYGKLTIKYALEDIFDNAMRSTIGGRHFDDIVQAKTSIPSGASENAPATTALKSTLEKLIECRADADVACFGIDVTGITTSGIKSSPETEEARRQVQVEAMNVRKQEQTTKLESQKVKTEKQIREQKFIQGDAAGGKEERTIKGIIKSGVSKNEAAQIRKTQILAEAIQNAESPILVLGTGSGNNIAEGVGLGIGAGRAQSREKPNPEKTEKKSKRGEK